MSTFYSLFSIIINLNFYLHSIRLYNNGFKSVSTSRDSTVDASPSLVVMPVCARSLDAPPPPGSTCSRVVVVFPARNLPPGHACFLLECVGLPGSSHPTTSHGQRAGSAAPRCGSMHPSLGATPPIDF